MPFHSGLDVSLEEVAGNGTGFRFRLTFAETGGTVEAAVTVSGSPFSSLTSGANTLQVSLHELKKAGLGPRLCFSLTDK